MEGGMKEKMDSILLVFPAKLKEKMLDDILRELGQKTMELEWLKKKLNLLF